MPSLPFNGGTIGPDGFDEYRAQGTMWLHRTLQGAPPGDWYSGSFELLVLWVHYGRPKGEWPASSLAAVLGGGNSAIATSLHQRCFSLPSLRSTVARVPALSSNEEWCGKRGQCSKAWSVAERAVAAGDADCDPTPGCKGLPAVDESGVPRVRRRHRHAADVAGCRRCRAAAAHRVPFVLGGAAASRLDAHVGVKVAAGKRCSTVLTAHSRLVCGTDVVGLSEALRQRFNASHGRRRVGRYKNAYAVFAFVTRHRRGCARRI